MFPLTWKGRVVMFLSLLPSIVKARLTFESLETLPSCSLTSVTWEEDEGRSALAARWRKKETSTSVATIGFWEISRIWRTISSGCKMLTVPLVMEAQEERASIAQVEPSIPRTEIAVWDTCACSPICRDRESSYIITR